MNSINTCNVTNCQISKAINIIKSRYSAVIILSLHKNDKNFSTLSKEFDYLTNMQLTRTLNLLKNHKIIIKKDQNYKLSELGQKLIPSLLELEKWSEENL